MQNINKLARVRRKTRIRKKIKGTVEQPRLTVFKSLNNIYAQIIDDINGKTLISACSLEKEIKGSVKRGSNLSSAKLIGEIIAKRAIDKGISKIVFDRSGYIYHGKIKAIADGAREKGLIF